MHAYMTSYYVHISSLVSMQAPPSCTLKEPAWDEAMSQGFIWGLVNLLPSSLKHYYPL